MPLKQVLGDLWGGEVPDHAVGAVRTYASRLRAVLEARAGPPRPRGGRGLVGDGYTLRTPGDPALSVDVHAFTAKVAEAERLRAAAEPKAAYDRLGAALALWQGEALLGVPARYAEQQRGWLGPATAVRRRGQLELGLELGHHGEVLDALDTLVSEQPAARAPARAADARPVTGAAGRPRRWPASPRSASCWSRSSVWTRARSSAHCTSASSTPTRSWPHPRSARRGHGRRVPVRGTGPTAHRHTRLRRTRGAAGGRGRGPAGAGRQAVPVIALFGIGGSGKTTLACTRAPGPRPVPGRPAVRGPARRGAAHHRSRTGAGRLPAQPGGRPGRHTRGAGRALRAVPLAADRAADADPGRQRPGRVPGAAAAAGHRGCAVLITSRVQLAELPGTRLFEIEPFRRTEALDLFAAVIGAERAAAEPEAVEALVAACGYLPLAVRILASRLAVRPAWSAAALAERLADQERRLDELHLGSLGVEATFQLSYEQLSPEQARAFRLLALPEGQGLTTAAAAAVIGLPDRRTEDVLESLHSAGLLLSRTPGRYQYHDLLRLFARRRSESEDSAAQRAEAVLLLLDHLLAGMVSVSRVLDPDGALFRHFQPTRTAGLRFTDREQAARWPHGESALIFAVTEQVVRNAADPHSGAAPAAPAPNCARRWICCSAWCGCWTGRCMPPGSGMCCARRVWPRGAGATGPPRPGSAISAGCWTGRRPGTVRRSRRCAGRWNCWPPATLSTRRCGSR
ncbi:hypothetical protein GXW82_08360 [Streptacidiphilus sp. 4-A2]|nr:hypothetical protein [Streptacidiphilus sp. 4-A2]